MKGQAFNKRLSFALNGIYLAFCNEQSLRLHTIAAIGVVIVLTLTNAPALWWALGALAVGFVITAELFNAAIETLADHLHPDHHPLIGAAKDIAAGAVLIATITALCIAGAFLFRLG